MVRAARATVMTRDFSRVWAIFVKKAVRPLSEIYKYASFVQLLAGEWHRKSVMLGASPFY